MLKLENSKNILGYVESPKGKKALSATNSEILTKALTAAVTAKECADAKPLIDSLVKTAISLGYDPNSILVSCDVKHVVLGSDKNVVRWYRDFTADSTLANVLNRVSTADSIRNLVDGFSESTKVTIRSTHSENARVRSPKTAEVSAEEAF